MKIILHKFDLPENSKFKNSDSVAIDAESLGLNYLQRDKLCLAQICSGDDEVHIIQFDRKKYSCPNFVKILENDKIKKIGHFIRFEMGIFNRYLNAKTKNVYCTKIASKLVRTYTDKHGLFDLTKDLIGITINKAMQSSDWGANELSKEQLNYAATDVINLHKIKTKLDRMLIREKRDVTANKCFNFLETIVDLDLKDFKEDIFSH